MNRFEFYVEEYLNLPPENKASLALIGEMSFGKIEIGDKALLQYRGKSFLIQVVLCEVYRRKPINELTASSGYSAISVSIDKKQEFRDFWRGESLKGALVTSI